MCIVMKLAVFVGYFILPTVVDAFGLAVCSIISQETKPSSSLLRPFSMQTCSSNNRRTQLYQDLNPEETRLVLEDDESIKKKMDEIDAVTLEAQAALQQAQVALQQAQQKQGKQILEDATAAGIGGASIGLFAGAALDVYLATNGDSIRDSLGMDIPTAVPPILLGAALGISSFSLASSTEEGNVVGPAVRKTLGKATQAVGKSIQSSISNAAQSAIQTVALIPSKIRSFFQRKAQEAVEEIKSIPSKIATAAQQQAESIKEAAVETVERTVDDIKATPARVANKISTAAQETAESIKDAAVDAVERTVDDIKATPGRIVDRVQRTVDQTVESIETTIEEAVEDVIEKVEEVASFPGKKLDEVRFIHFSFFVFFLDPFILFFYIGLTFECKLICMYVGR